MRITFLCSSMRLSGGMRVVVQHCNSLTQRGHNCTIVAPGGTVDPTFRAELEPGVTVLETPVKFHPAMDAGAMARLSWSMAATAPKSDIVLSTHTPTVVAGWIATALMRKGQPAWLFQDYAAMFDGRPFEQSLFRHALRWHKVAYANSAWAGAEIAAQAPHKIVVNGVGLSQLELLTPVYFEDRDPSGPRRILSFGDDRPRKGMADFLAAAAIVAKSEPDLHLTLFAKEPVTIETELPYTLVKRPSRLELARLYQSCHLFVSASHWESLGLAPLEAMACAAPVALADAGGVRDYAIDGVNCLMTPPQHPEALAGAMLRLLRDKQLAARVSRAAPAVAARYDWENIADGFEADLLRLAGGGPIARPTPARP